jgi:hypothetical protein
MEKIRPILRPAVDGKNVTLAEARAALRELNQESRGRAKKRAQPRHKPAAKAE